MAKRAKRKSGCLDRYLTKPSNMTGLDLRNTEKLKTKNPMAEFEAEQLKTEQPFLIQAKEPKVEQIAQPRVDSVSLTVETPVENDFTSEANMPLYCNYCSMAKRCPQGRAVLKRKDQAQLVVCSKRNDFRQLVSEAGTSDRQGLLKYIHKLRNVNATRIGRLIYSEALSGDGQDRNLSLLIDKQIDSALAEYKLLTPQDKNINKFSFQLTHIHNTVDTFNQLPTDMKTHLLQALKGKLQQFKNPLTIDNILNTTEPMIDTQPTPLESEVTNNKEHTINNHQPLPYSEASTREASEQDTINEDREACGQALASQGVEDLQGLEAL